MVGHEHHSHSFVRGNWGNEGRSSFMLLQKCCHDLDILQWLLGKECQRIQSFGSLTHFCRANAPEGSPERCIEGCPVGDSCVYNAVKLYLENDNHWFRTTATLKPLGQDTDEEVIRALKETQYGKCVYKCDNDVVDHQIVNMEFEDGVTVAMTMCPFTRGGRRMRIMGTKGELVADMRSTDKTFDFIDFDTFESRDLDDEIKGAGDSILSGHGGGDQGIINDLYDYLTDNLDPANVSEIGVSCKNHMMAFAAETSRLSGTVVSLDEYMEKYMN